MSYYTDKSSWFNDDPDWGIDDINYKSSTISVVALSLFFVLSLILLSINSIAAYNQYQHLVFVKLGYRPGLWSNTHTRLNLLQVLGSFLNVLNQIYFLLLEIGRGLPCPFMVTLGGFIYISLVVCVSSVMEQRSTTLLKGKHRQIVRICMYILILIAIGNIAASNALRVWNYNLLKVGVCSAVWNRKLNTIGKGCIAILYTWFIFVFIKPLYQHSQAMRNITSQQGNRTTMRLNDLVRTLFIKIIICVGTLVFTTLLGTFQLFGRYTTIEFSIQNAAMVYASTLALERFGRRRNMDGESATGTASIMEETEPETSGVSITLVASRTGRKSNLQIHSNKPMARPSVPTPFAASPRTANYGVSILTSTAASPLQVNGQFNVQPLELISPSSKLSKLSLNDDDIVTMDVSSSSSQRPQSNRKYSNDILNSIPIVAISEDDEEEIDFNNDSHHPHHSYPQSNNNNLHKELGLRRVCSEVWVGEDNEATLINMVTLNTTSATTIASTEHTTNKILDHHSISKNQYVSDNMQDLSECWVAAEEVIVDKRY